MKTLVRTYLLILICAAFTACSKSEEKEERENGMDMAIAFSGMEAAASRASKLSTVFDSFSVFTTKTMNDNSKQTVMPNYTVKYDGQRWYYDGIDGQELKFWDFSAASYTFAAVSPAPSGDASKGFDASVTNNDDGISIYNAKGNIAYSNGMQKCADWMIARTIRTKATMTDRDDFDPAKLLHDTTNDLSAFHEDVPLNFRHIFARVDFAAYCDNGEIALKAFKVEVADPNTDKIINMADHTEALHWTNPRAIYVFNESSIDAVADEEYLDDGRVIYDDADNPVVLASRIQIPQGFPDDGREFIVTFVTTNDEIYSGHIVIDSSNNGSNSWKENHHYTYILKIETKEENNVILFGVNMEEWQWIEGNRHDDEETNW